MEVKKEKIKTMIIFMEKSIEKTYQEEKIMITEKKKAIILM